MAAMQAFNAPYSMMMLEIDAVGMYDTAAEEMGKTFVTTELGGGGTPPRRTVAIAKRGVRNLLSPCRHPQGPAGAPRSARHAVRRLLHLQREDGLIEPCVDLGQGVRSGDLLLRLHPTDRLGRPPLEYRARLDGVLAARHFPGLAALGDCLPWSPGGRAECLGRFPCIKQGCWPGKRSSGLLAEAVRISLLLSQSPCGSLIRSNELITRLRH